MIGMQVSPKPPQAKAPSTQQKPSVRPKSLQIAPSVQRVNHTPPGIIYQNIGDVVKYCEKFLDCTARDCNPPAPATIYTICQNLKRHGSQMESICKDLLDRVFVCFRKSSMDETLDAITRMSLLEAIELRAGNWQLHEPTVNYYTKKLNFLLDGTTFTPDLASSRQLGVNLAPTTVVASFNQVTSPMQAAPPSPPTLLQPGQVVKSTGKYGNYPHLPPSSHPTATAGPVQSAGNSNNRNQYKDEVVIRNADSGKVMGIKGRRVHLIEEISDTVISFQRVNPGAKERLVQITGSDSSSIQTAKQLIEQTIQRNQSPVPLSESDAMAAAAAEGSETASNSSSVASASVSALATDETGVKLFHSASSGLKLNLVMMDPVTLDDYQHTVTVGEHSIKIVGNNLQLVQTAKLVLDEFFSANDRNRSVSTYISSEGIGSRQTTPRDLEGAVPCSSTPSPSLSSYTRTVVAESSENPMRTAVNSGGLQMMKVLKYDRKVLIHFSKSPLCRNPPPNWHLVQKEVPDILRLPLENELNHQDEENGAQVNEPPTA